MIAALKAEENPSGGQFPSKCLGIARHARSSASTTNACQAGIRGFSDRSLALAQAITPQCGRIGNFTSFRTSHDHFELHISAFARARQDQVSTSGRNSASRYMLAIKSSGDHPNSSASPLWTSSQLSLASP